MRRDEERGIKEVEEDKDGILGEKEKKEWDFRIEEKKGMEAYERRKEKNES